MALGSLFVSAPLPQLYLARHGATEWSVSGRHTGRTDVPLTPEGERDAAALAGSLEGLDFGLVLTSPLQRARRTCELAGFGARAEVDSDLAEWDYGDFEGLTLGEIHARRPGWALFRDGCPGGESVEAVAARADRVVGRLRGLGGRGLVFAHGHLLRVLAVRWVGLPAAAGRNLALGTAAVSVLGYQHGRGDPAIVLWNARCGAS